MKLDYNYSDQQLLLLLKHAENDFIRWDAAQMLLSNELRHNLQRLQNGEAMQVSPLLLDTLHTVLENYQQDVELTALMLTLPKETEFAEQFKVIDPSGIHTVRKFLRKSIAEHLKALLLKIYHRIDLPQYRIERQDIALRSLRNCCLSYLAVTEFGNALVNTHYLNANTLCKNMTDSLAALAAATSAMLPCRDKLLADFEQKWSHDGLVMDKWFALQATRPDEDVLQNVMQLMDHPSFKFNNPNRLRALVGSFAAQNPNAFHAIDGSGYRFLVEVLIKVNSSNPQVASRLIEPLIRLGRYDAQRQTLMKRGLERLSKIEDLSKDLFEKIEKALD